MIGVYRQPNTRGASMAATEYPEHDRLAAIQAESQAIGEFLEFGGYTLCKWREAGDNGEPRYVWNEDALRRRPERSAIGASIRDYFANRAIENPAYDGWGAGWEAVGRPITRVLADYFEIDLNKIEAEKRAMLDAIRSAA